MKVGAPCNAEISWLLLEFIGMILLDGSNYSIKEDFCSVFVESR